MDLLDPDLYLKGFNNHFTKLYSNKLENSEVTDRFLDTFKLPKLNQDVLKTLNNPVKGNEIEAR